MARVLTTASVLLLFGAAITGAPALAASQNGNSGTTSQTRSSSASSGNGSSSASSASGSESSASGSQKAQQAGNNAGSSFVTHAIQAGRSEVAEGKLAMKQSFQPAIREFGRWMVTDHGRIDWFLKHEAQKAGITVPSGESQQAQSEDNSLKNLNSTSFDRHYINHQVAAHQKAVKLFRKEAQSGKNARMRQLAKQVVPVLKQHLAEAQQLQNQLPALSAEKR